MKKLKIVKRVYKKPGTMPLLLSPRPEESMKLSEWLAYQEHGQLVQVTYQRLSPAKTNSQLAYYYGVLIPSGIATFKESQGDDSIPGFTINDQPVKATKETMDIYFKKIYEQYQLAKDISKESMSIEEFSKFLDWLVDWFDGQGVVPPEAEKK